MTAGYQKNTELDDNLPSQNWVNQPWLQNGWDVGEDWHKLEKMTGFDMIWSIKIIKKAIWYSMIESNGKWIYSITQKVHLISQKLALECWQAPTTADTALRVMRKLWL